jgi:RNA polymerase sigma-70 factor (ECF subfamily)
MQGFIFLIRIMVRRRIKMDRMPANNTDPITLALQTYADMVRRICFLYLRNSTEADDVFQEVFIKLMQKSIPFTSTEHEKAWLIRVAINTCKDIRKSFWSKKVHLTTDVEIPSADPAENEILQIVLSLPQKYKEVVYLHYYEDYSIPQIAALFNKKENTVYSQLHRARALIKKELGGRRNEKSVKICIESN